MMVAESAKGEPGRGARPGKAGKSRPAIGFEQNGGQLRRLKVLDAGPLAVRDQPLLIDYILSAAGLE